MVTIFYILGGLIALFFAMCFVMVLSGIKQKHRMREAQDSLFERGRQLPMPEDR